METNTEKLERIVEINKNIMERYEWLLDNYNKLQAGWELVIEESKTLAIDDLEGWERLVKKVDLLQEAEHVIKREGQLIRELDESTK